MPARGPILIEMSGVPGSGKTSILRALRRDDAFFGPHCLTSFLLPRHPLFQRLIKYIPSNLATRHLDHHLTAHHHTLTTTNPRILHLLDLLYTEVRRGYIDPRARTWVLNAFIWQEFARTHLNADQIFINDEGTIHRATSLFADLDLHAHAPLLDAYLNTLPPVDLIIITDAPDTLCLDRMATRHKGFPQRLRGRSHLEIQTFLRRCRTITSRAETIAQRHQTPTLRLSTANQCPDDALPLIHDALKSLRAQPSLPPSSLYRQDINNR